MIVVVLITSMLRSLEVALACIDPQILKALYLFQDDEGHRRYVQWRNALGE
jgi:hypothetical protein